MFFRELNVLYEKLKVVHDINKLQLWFVDAHILNRVLGFAEMTIKFRGCKTFDQTEYVLGFVPIIEKCCDRVESNLALYRINLGKSSNFLKLSSSHEIKPDTQLVGCLLIELL
jgi:hypothetical protein